MEEAPVNAIVRRANELLAAYDARKDKGGGHLPENPYEVLRGCKEWVEKLADMLASECQDSSRLRRELDRVKVIAKSLRNKKDVAHTARNDHKRGLEYWRERATEAETKLAAIDQ